MTITGGPTVNIPTVALNTLNAGTVFELNAGKFMVVSSTTPPAGTIGIVNLLDGAYGEISGTQQVLACLSAHLAF